MAKDDDKILEILLDAIEMQRVVPIIGDEFYYADVNGTLVNYRQYILNALSKKFNPPKDAVSDFNMIADLIRLNNQMQSLSGCLSDATSIYYEIGDIVRNTPVVCDQCLVDFLSCFHFPLILTTSYLPGLEMVLDKPVTVKAYDKTPRIDIGALNSQSSVLYYLFGKYSKANKTYMVTEDDLLDYLHLWHNIETRPRNLSEYLNDKFLLLLGCNYPNWIFRFFWHSVKNFNLLSGNDGLKGVVASSMLNKDNELLRFLSRIQTQSYADGKSFMEKLVHEKKTMVVPVGNEVEDNEAEDGEIIGGTHCDVFLSYSHQGDIDLAKAVAEVFRKYGANIWFDDRELHGGDGYDKIIKEKISECHRFVPILSLTTERRMRGYFRQEWSWALDELRYRVGGSPYVVPIVIDEVAEFRTIPEQFAKAHMLNYHSADFESEIKRLIRSFRQ